MRYYPGPHGGMGIWFGIAGFVGTLLVIALIVALVVVLVRRNKQPSVPVHPGAGNPAVHLLDQRLAAGEIDIADYQARKAALTGEAPPRPEWTPPPAEPPAPPDEDKG